MNEDAFEEGSSARDRDPDFDFAWGRGRGTLARSFPPPEGDEPASPRSARARCLSRRAALAPLLEAKVPGGGTDIAYALGRLAEERNARRAPRPGEGRSTDRAPQSDEGRSTDRAPQPAAS